MLISELILTKSIKKSRLAIRNQQIAPKLPFDPIPRPERAQGDYGKKKLPFNRKKHLAEPDSVRVAIHLNHLGFERTGKRGQQAP